MSPALRNRTSGRYAAALCLLGLATAIVFHGVVAHPGSRIPAGFNDATGALRDYWAASVQHRNPLTFTRDALDAAPDGFPRTPATVLADGGIQTLFVWELRGPLGPVGAWNAFLLLGMLGTGMAMFALLGRLGCTFTASLFGAYVLAFAPFALERAYAGHLGLLQNWVLVAVVAALFRLRQRRSLAAAALVGLGIALAFYDSAYPGLLAAFTTLVFLIVELARAPARRERLRSVVLGGTAYFVTGIALVPILVLYARERTDVQGTTSHQAADFYTYAAALAAYLVPSPRNPLFHWVRGIHPGSLTEETLFYGYTTLALAVVAVVLLRRRDDWLRSTETRWWSAVFMIVLVPAALLMSLAPTRKIGPVSVPMPSSLLGHVTSFWRVYSRFGVLVGLGLAVLAALALTALAGRPGRGRRLLAPAALAVVVLELLPGNVRAFDTNARPAWVDWLGAQPRGIVMSYPVTDQVAAEDGWYQVFDHQPRFQLPGGGAGIWHSRTAAIRLLAKDVNERLTPQVLATEGVRYVVVHADAYTTGKAPRINPRRFRLLKSFGSTRIYSVSAPRLDIGAALKAHAFKVAARQGFAPPPITYLRGFQAPERYENEPSRWLIQDGVLRLDNQGPSMSVILTGIAFSNQAPHLLELVDAAGHVLARQQVTVAAVSLHLGPFPIPTGRSYLELVAQPGPVPLGPADPREASVFLLPLAARPIPAYTGG